MKKITILTLLIASVFTASAQLGIRGGAVISALKFDGSGNTVKNLMGVNLGLTNAFGDGSIQFKTGLIFTQKGYRAKGLNDDVKLRINYIDIPLNLSVKIDDKFSVEGGPYLGIGINAFTKIGSDKDEVKFEDNSLQRLGGGLNAGVNYMVMSNLQLGLSYNLGLVNINDGSSDIFNRYANISLTYLLGK